MDVGGGVGHIVVSPYDVLDRLMEKRYARTRDHWADAAAGLRDGVPRVRPRR